ncbi:MAG: two-component system response regulator [Desulfotalea sp.]|nr:MAG: two-component system response regulator [Desulfotalea sp.]
MKPKILVIEDNEQNMYLVTFLLSKNGYEVIQAHDGSQGIDLAKKHLPALILLDVQLPVMNGYQVAHELKKDISFKEIPVIAVTSHAMPGDREKAMEAGCTGYIEKPINPDTFINDFQKYMPGFHPLKGTNL